MSVIGNQPGVSSQRTVLEEVVTGSPKSAFVPQAGYIKGYVDVLVNGIEIDATDFTAADGITVTLATAAAVGDTVKIKAWLPRGLSDGYTKAEADARYVQLYNGKAGVGTTTPQKLFVVSNNGANGIEIQPDDASTSGLNRMLSYNRTSGAYTPMVFQGSEYRIYTKGTSADESVRVDNNGNVTLYQGNLVMANGKGIDFSANGNASGMTSELLDDYERGTWSPVPWVSYGSGSITGHSSQGTYIKIGNLVHVKFQLYGITWSGSPGNLGVTGLPFTINSSAENYSSGVAQNLSNGHMYQLEMGAGSNYISVIRKYDNGSAYTNQSVGFAGSATYFV